MVKKLLIRILNIMLLLQAGILSAQDNQEPPHAFYEVEEGRELPLPLLEYRPGKAGYGRTFEYRSDWENRQVFTRIPGMEIPYSFLVNGFVFGSDSGSMVPAEYNITPFLHQGTNSIEVRTAFSGPYTCMPECPLCEKGSLVIRNNLHVRELAVYAYPGKQESEMLIRAHIFIKSYCPDRGSPGKVILKVNAPSGEEVFNQERMVPPMAFGQESELVYDSTVSKPGLWSPLNPLLYGVEVTLSASDGSHPETTSASFGIRTAQLSDSTVIINGETVRLQPARKTLADSLILMTGQEITDLFRKQEFNAIVSRTPLPACLVNLCDTHGILVIRDRHKAVQGAVRPQVNSPSIILPE